MTTLDLSGNNFTGPLPERISEQMPYVSFLDLSNNSFSGGIPASIMNMTYLNVLVLQHNQFTGGIPAINLSRLISFDVADNSLTGPVPDSLQGFPAGNFTGNPGLCGAPLGKKCKKRFRVRIHVRFIWIREMFVRIRKLLHRINDASIIGASAGFIFGGGVAPLRAMPLQPLQVVASALDQSTGDIWNKLQLLAQQSSSMFLSPFAMADDTKFILLFLLMSSSSSCSGFEQDIQCLRLHRINDQSSIGAAVGFVVGFVVAFYFPHCFVCSERLRAYVVRI
ncbi:hypothetical protein ZWY2020_046903 [Hordeum vulgare]|nr:hypothetical protein ZWY2020_046903 [Hordeum vulgare]